MAQGMTQMHSLQRRQGTECLTFLQEEELAGRERQDRMHLTDVRGEVVFDTCSVLAYPDQPEKVIIKDFSAHVLPGQKVAIVGTDGCRKDDTGESC